MFKGHAARGVAFAFVVADRRALKRQLPDGATSVSLGEVAENATDTPSRTQRDDSSFGTAGDSSWIRAYRIDGTTDALNLTVRAAAGVGMPLTRSHRCRSSSAGCRTEGGLGRF